jgi:hypothetical protein
MSAIQEQVRGTGLTTPEALLLAAWQPCHRFSVSSKVPVVGAQLMVRAGLLRDRLGPCASKLPQGRLPSIGSAVVAPAGPEWVYWFPPRARLERWGLRGPREPLPTGCSGVLSTGATTGPLSPVRARATAGIALGSTVAGPILPRATHRLGNRHRAGRSIWLPGPAPFW